jgi:ATP-binding cassette, subfamily B, multidrug efflux pump
MSVAGQNDGVRVGAWSYLAKYRRSITWGVVMLIATNAFFVGIPVTTGRIVQAIRDGNYDQIMPLCLWMSGFAIATAITRIISRITIFNAARAAEYDLRSDLFAHLLHLDASYHREHPTGETMSRITSDVQTVRAMWGAGILNLANTAFAFATVLVMMFRIDTIVTIAAIAPYPLIYFIGQTMGKYIYRGSQAVQAQVGALSARLQEDLGGIAIIKSYTLEPIRRIGFAQASNKVLASNMALARTRLLLEPNLRALASAGLIIALWVGGVAVADGRISIGKLFEFNGYLARLVWPTLALGWMISLLQRGRGSWSRLEAVLQTKPHIVDGPGPALAHATVPPDVVLHNMNIAIDNKPLLSDINLTLASGSITALVGPTGGGKSTLVDALLRLVDVAPGAITINQRDVTDLPLASLRGAIGYAPQDAFLFSMSIADNIGMGLRGVDVDHDFGNDQRVIDAAKTAGLHNDLARMPDGLRTIVGERGITLSGGQRQRVALARALVGQPLMLILDDSLSSVDAETERAILANLRQTRVGRTVVLVSHRVAAVKDADQIIVLDGGRIVEQGTHQSLLDKTGLYAGLYQSQLDTDHLSRSSHATEAAS